MENLPLPVCPIKELMDRQECLSYQSKTRCLTLGHGSGSLKVPSCELLATLPAFSSQPTRCLDANDGWHDGVRLGGCVCFGKS
jgi:hypothetical protein